jgi:hypothetical protein
VTAVSVTSTVSISADGSPLVVRVRTTPTGESTATIDGPGPGRDLTAADLLTAFDVLTAARERMVVDAEIVEDDEVDDGPWSLADPTTGDFDCSVEGCGTLPTHRVWRTSDQWGGEALCLDHLPDHLRTLVEVAE